MWRKNTIQLNWYKKLSWFIAINVQKTCTIFAIPTLWQNHNSIKPNELTNICYKPISKLSIDCMIC